MNTPFFLARKYFLSKNNRGFVNIIALISIVVISFGAMSLVLVLSVFNGIEELVRKTYQNVDSDLIIRMKNGKFFESKQIDLLEIKSVRGIKKLSEIIEDNALLKFKDKQKIVKIKAINQEFIQSSDLEKTIVLGKFLVNDQKAEYMVLGRGLQWDFGLDLQNNHGYIQIYYPKNILPSGIIPGKLFYQGMIQPAGFFSIEKEYDDNYVFVSLGYFEKLIDKKNKRTAIEIELDEINKKNLSQIKQKIHEKLPKNFEIISGDELHADIYKVMKIEKLFVFLIFIIILSISSINSFFSLTMMIIDKQKDIYILYSLGATRKFIQKMFLFEGFLITISGAVLGLILGMIIAYIQQKFGIVKLGMEMSIVQYYPVKIEIFDIIYIFIIISIISIVAISLPVMKIKYYIKS